MKTFDRRTLEKVISKIPDCTNPSKSNVVINIIICLTLAKDFESTKNTKNSNSSKKSVFQRLICELISNSNVHLHISGMIN